MPMMQRLVRVRGLVGTAVAAAWKAAVAMQFSASCSTHSSGIRHLGGDRSRQRFEATLMYGRHVADDATLRGADFDALQALRIRASGSVIKRDVSMFHAIVDEAVQWMGQLPADHALHFPSHLAFVNAPAPWNGPFKRGVASIFFKVADSRARARNEKMRPHNAGGMTLAGGRGVGKSNGLRLLTLVPALLFPDDVVSAYVDYAAAAATPSPPPPSELLRDALRCAVGDEALPAPESPIETVLDAVKASRRVAILAADELEAVYGNQLIWSEFHTMATMYSPTLFLADSGSKVRAMVERRGHEGDLRRWFPALAGNLPASLNQDKLPITPLLPFTAPDQYRAFLSSRDTPTLAPALISEPPLPLASGEWDLIIHGMHARTGGRLRAMQQQLLEEQPMCCLPSPGTAALAVLAKLGTLQAARVGVGDARLSAFHMAAVSSSTVRCWLKEHAAKHGIAAAGDADLNSLLDASVLQETGTGEYTFGCFDLYRKLRHGDGQQRPQVFVSLARGDREHPSVAALRAEIDRRGVADTVLCTDDPDGTDSDSAVKADSEDSMTRRTPLTGPGLAGAPWMRDIATPRADHYVVIALSDRYIQRACTATHRGDRDGSESGVLTELTAAVAWMREAALVPGADKHIVAVSLDGLGKLASWKAAHPLVKELADRATVYSLPVCADGDGERHSASVQRVADRILGAPARPALQAAT